MNVRPSLRQTEEGKALLSEARVRMNQTYYDKSGVTAEDEIADTVNLEKLMVKPKAPLTEVFKDIKPIEGGTGKYVNGNNVIHMSTSVC